MGFFSQFTGKDVSAKVDEYSEVYGQVLLGMHQKLEFMDRELAAAKKIKQELIDAESIKENARHHYEKTKNVYEEIKQHYAQLKKQTTLLLLRLDQQKSEMEKEIVSLRESFANSTEEMKTRMHAMEQQLDKKVQDIYMKLEEAESQITSKFSEVDMHVESLHNEIKQVKEDLETTHTQWEMKIRKRDRLFLAACMLLLSLTVWAILT